MCMLKGDKHRAYITLARGKRVYGSASTSRKIVVGTLLSKIKLDADEKVAILARVTGLPEKESFSAMSPHGRKAVWGSPFKVFSRDNSFTATARHARA